MKKYLFIIITLLTSLVASSCQDEDFGYTSTEIKYRTAFQKAFGKIPADQNWDFYEQAFSEKSVATRAGSSIHIEESSNIPCNSDAISTISSLVPTNRYNGTKGNQAPTLIYQGEFIVQPIQFNGTYEKEVKYNFEFGIEIEGGDNEVLFTSQNQSAQQAKKITMNEGTAFRFFIEFKYKKCGTCNGNGNTWTLLGGNRKCTACDGSGLAADTHKYYSNGEHCRTIYNQGSAESGSKIMALAFEDSESLEKGYPWWATLFRIEYPTSPNFCDFIVAIDGNLPNPTAKRFLCEDLEGSYESSNLIDYNDLVFDLQPNRNGTTDVVIQAVGGTLPISLSVNGTTITKNGKTELHAIMGVPTNQPVNVGAASITGETNRETGEPLIVSADAVTINIQLDLSTESALNNFRDVSVLITTNEGQNRTISFTNQGVTPYIIAAPTETNWMKENICIKRGYPDFFTGDWWKNMVSSNVVD